MYYFLLSFLKKICRQIDVVLHYYTSDCFQIDDFSVQDFFGQIS